MHFPRPTLTILFAFSISLPIAAQQAPQRDAQAIAILQQSLAAMGAIVPTDSVATGAIVIVAGSLTEQGAIRILTRGLDQSAEQIQTGSATRAVIYSRGLGAEVEGASVKSLQMELVVTSQSPDFPVPFLAAVLNNSETAIQYLGLENLEGFPAHHIRFWNTFSSKPRLQKLADFSVKDLWIDAASVLPHKLSYNRRAGGGSEPRIPVEVFFSDYRNAGGVLYPFLIKKSYNGTPWIAITVQNVAFNTGLTDADFPVQ